MKTFNEFVSSFNEEKIFTKFAESLSSSDMHPGYVFGAIIENLMASTDKPELKQKLAQIEQELNEGFWDNWKKNGLGSYTQPISYGLGTALGGLKQGWQDAKAQYAQTQPQVNAGAVQAANATQTQAAAAQAAANNTATNTTTANANTVNTGGTQPQTQGTIEFQKVQNAMKLLSGRVNALSDGPLKQSLLKMVDDANQQITAPPVMNIVGTNQTVPTTPPPNAVVPQRVIPRGAGGRFASRSVMP